MDEKTVAQWARWHKAHLQYQDYLPVCPHCRKEGLAKAEDDLCTFCGDRAEMTVAGNAPGETLRVCQGHIDDYRAEVSNAE